MTTRKNAFTSIEIGVVANPTRIRTLSKKSLTSLLNISGEDIVLKNVNGLKKVSNYNLDVINTTSGVFRQDVVQGLNNFLCSVICVTPRRI